LREIKNDEGSCILELLEFAYVVDLASFFPKSRGANGAGSDQRFKFRNSWRPAWGDGSNNGYIAYSTIQNVTEYLGLLFVNQIALY
jgi:hypothetical protein